MLERVRSEFLSDLASEVVQSFELIADAAERRLSEPGIGLGALANANQITSQKAQSTLKRINDENNTAYRRLRDEPAIARVVVEDEGGQRKTIYVARATRVECGVNLCSYLTPMGRLASLPVGTEEAIYLPSGERWFSVVERAILRPVRPSAGWDSRDSVVQTDWFGPITVASLRTLLEEAGFEEADLAELDKLIEADAAQANVQEGLRRQMLTAMELRDQPLLDQFQDAIFRMPLGQQIVIIGPPGTGKTTTLIRRLKQKLEYLEPEELELVESKDVRDLPHSHSWLMFTPTELLKQYVHEAFAREDVPAPDQRIRTWDDHRLELARNLLPVLKSASGGTLIMERQKQALQPATILNQIDWFEDFRGFQEAEFLKRLVRDASAIAAAKEGSDAAIGRRLADILANVRERSVLATILAITGFSDDLRRINATARDATHKRLRQILAGNVNRDHSLLEELARFAASLDEDPVDDQDEVDEVDADADVDDEEEKLIGNRAAGQAAFLRATRAKAVAQARKRTIKPASRNGRLLAWLTDRGVELPDLAPIGEILMVQQAARRLMRAPRDYVRQVPTDYRVFRRARTGEGKWYIADVLTGREITSFEVDIILLAMLRNARALLSDRALMRSLDGELPLIVEQIKGAHRNQILVDEAPDFSPVQLACMAALTSLRTESFFACGDFNQRLTTWGSRSKEQLDWVYPRLEVRPITVAYRQSRRLNELAHALVAEGDRESLGTVPEGLDNEGVPPVLGRKLADKEDLARWLASRIVEIEKFTGKLPSIAVLVNDKAELEPLAASLDEALHESNIRAVACPDGRVMGRDNDVRIFEVKHIKGLEFEAVFFIDVDRLEGEQPELFEKYLYVGATRAATYLGLTTNGSAAPKLIEDIGDMFGDNWVQT